MSDQSNQPEPVSTPAWEEMSQFESELFMRSIIGYSRKISAPPSPVYHYTSPEVFAKIVDTCTFRLSNAGYLNDQGELTYPIQVGRFALRLAQHKHKDEELSQFFEEAIKTLDTHALFKSWFVASFSLQGNLLSQWRAYCSRGGYSIGLKPAETTESIKSAGRYEFGEVIYDLERQATLVMAQIDRHIALWRELRQKYPDEPKNEFDHKLAQRLGLAMSEEFVFFKSEAFAEEAEWRLVRYYLPFEDNIAFFERNGVLTPYVEVTLSVEKRLPLEMVFVSPLAEPELASHAAQLVLQAKGHAEPRNLISVPSYRLRF